ncbi:MAG: hypothetical protein ACKOA8_07600, partial [Deltaproteobacteria bacterium]
MGTVLKNQRGQALVEWLLLLAASFLTGYVVISGPFATFTTNLLDKIRGYTGSIVLKGESSSNAPSP